jgi:hypothetical protein
VEIEQPREHEASRGVDFTTAVARSLRFHARDAIFFDDDIDRPFMAANNGVANNHIHQGTISD